MVAPTPNSAPSVSGDDRNIVTIDDSYLALSVEDRLQMFWEKNRGLIITAGVVVVLGLVARWGFEQYAAYRERQVQDAYTRASSAADLEAFAQTNPAAALSGVARLRLADESYKTGDYRTASTAYSAAALLLNDTPLLDRARLGAALSSLQAQDAGAVSALETVANDITLTKVSRAEAAYRLAVLARDAGRNEDALRWANTVSTVDISGTWSQRANQLKEQLPATAAIPVAVTPAEAGAAVSFPGTSK